MKRMLIAALLALAPGLASADPAEGMWKTQVDDGAYAYVEMGPCSGGRICGWIRRTFDDNGEYQSENIGKAIVINMEPQGNGFYKGKVWRPSNDKIYIGKMQVNGDQLSLDGCVLGGLICASQTWTRIQ